MKKYKFKGDWKFDLKLSECSKLHSDLVYERT